MGDDKDKNKDNQNKGHKVNSEDLKKSGGLNTTEAPGSVEAPSNGEGSSGSSGEGNSTSSDD